VTRGLIGSNGVRSLRSAVQPAATYRPAHPLLLAATLLVPSLGLNAASVGSPVRVSHAESSTSPARARSSGGPLARRPSSKMSPSGARPLQRMVWE